MMQLDYWKKKFQEKRKHTPVMEFITEVMSWKPFGFYKNKGLISRYPDTPRVKNIVSPKEFSTLRDAMPYVTYDATKTFFQNFQDLLLTVPLASLVQFNLNENCDFSDCIFTAKNVYLSQVVGGDAENIYYSAFIYREVKDVFNSVLVNKNSSQIFQSTFIEKSYKIFYSKYIQNSSDIWFSTNLVWCTHCIFCDGLENVSYSIKNVKLEKEEYEKQKQEILKEKTKFDSYFLSLSKKALNYGAVNCSGNALYFSENIENWFFVSRVKNGRNVFYAGIEQCEDFYDCFDVGLNSNNFYAACSAWEVGSNHFYSVAEVGSSSNIFYSYHLEKCHYCIGCIWLRNKEFCIFNKQYTKEEWYTLADEIFSNMEKDGSFGKYFPAWLTPFYYNDTMAYFVNPTVKKEDILQLWYLWREEKIKVDIPQWIEIMRLSDLWKFEVYINGQWILSEEILKKVIQDSEGNIYRVIKEEYDFLTKHELPLPRLHWMDRIKMCMKN